MFINIQYDPHYLHGTHPSCGVAREGVHPFSKHGLVFTYVLTEQMYYNLCYYAYISLILVSAVKKYHTRHFMRKTYQKL